MKSLYWNKVLRINTRLMKKALAKKDFKRIVDLTLHRSLVKDCINEALTKEKSK
jgi:hypothetical protein